MKSNFDCEFSFPTKAIENISGFSKNDVTTLTLYFYMFLNRKTFQQCWGILQSIMQGQKKWDIPTLYVRGWLVNKPNIFHPFQGTKRQTELFGLYLAGSQLFCIETFIFPIKSLGTAEDSDLITCCNREADILNNLSYFL